MKIAEVATRVHEIYEKKFDFETAHGLEDRLYVDILTYIASGKCLDISYARELAKTALVAQNIDFPRYRA